MKQSNAKILMGLLLRYLLGAAVLLSMGCSNQWREADFEIDPSEMEQVLEDVTASSGDGQMSTAKGYMQTEGSIVYFSEAPGPFGPVASVASLYNFDFLGSSAAGVMFFDMAEVKVFVALVPSTGDAALIFAYKLYGEDAWRSSALLGSYSTSSTKFTASLLNSEGLQVVLTSNDVFEGDLTSIVQMKMRSEDASGVMDDNGQISTLMGFGG